MAFNKNSKVEKSVRSVQPIRDKLNFRFLLKGSDKEKLKVSNVVDNISDMDGSIIHWKFSMNSKYYCPPQTQFAEVMFLQVCVCPRGGGMRGRGACMAGGMCGGGGACMVVGGMHGRGVCMAVGVCVAGGHVWWGRAHYKIRSVNARSVCILLECILVVNNDNYSSTEQKILSLKLSSCTKIISNRKPWWLISQVKLIKEDICFWGKLYFFCLIET